MWDKLADKESVEKVMKELRKNGINSFFVNNEEEARNKIKEIVPNNSHVFTMSSVTLEETGIANMINESGNYDSVRNKLNSMDRSKPNKEMKLLGAVPEFALGSLQALTEDGKLMIASNTGSQMAAYVYGSEHVIFVVGTQKLVKNTNEGIKRIYDYVLQLENERVKKAYGIPGSFVSKLLIINREISPNRITVIFVNKKLGF